MNRKRLTTYDFWDKPEVSEHLWQSVSELLLGLYLIVAWLTSIAEGVATNPPTTVMTGKIRFANWSPLAFGLGSLLSMLTFLPHGSSKDSRQTDQHYNCWLNICVVIHKYIRKYDTPQDTVGVYWRLSSTVHESISSVIDIA